MNNYPPQLPPPPPQGPSGYNPFNPYQGYDPNADYVPWIPGRQGPRFLPIAIIVAAILVCSCCAFLAGTVFGIELPGYLAPSPTSGQNQNQNDNQQPTDEPSPTDTPGGLMWQVIYVRV